jgi:hypothetical protein
LADPTEEFCRRVRDGLASADFDRKRALLELLVDRVIVTDGEVEIRYALPTGPKGEREPFCRLRMDYQYAVPGAQRLGQATPGCPGAHHPQHRLQKQPIVRACATRIAGLPGSNGATRSHRSPLSTHRFKADLQFAALNQTLSTAGIPKTSECPHALISRSSLRNGRCLFPRIRVTECRTFRGSDLTC